MRIEINNQVYSIGKLSALDQMHLLRRIGPIIVSLGLSVQDLKSAGKDGWLHLIEPLMQAVKTLSDDEMESIIFGCLKVVKRVQETNVAPVLVDGNKIMFDDIDMVAMIRLCVEVAKQNLGGFFAELGAGTDSVSS